MAVALLLFTGGVARGESEQFIINQNQTGVALPGVVTPNGFDEVRAADGTTCRSSVASSGPYIDSGVIGGGLNGNTNAMAAYGRLVLPLGELPSRLDCDRLYQLELQRLELEVDLLRQGLDPRASTTRAGDWSKGSAWTNKSRR